MIRIKTVPTVIGARRVEARQRITINSRQDHALVIRLSGDVIYNYEGETIRSQAGDLVFIPKGASYSVTKLGKHFEFAIVYFDAEVEEDRMKIVHLPGTAEALGVFESLSRAVRIIDEEGRLLSVSHLYRLLAIAASVSTKEENGAKLRLISPALDYLRDHLYSPSLEIGSLHTLAGISAVYFRRLFSTYMGMQPSKYVAERRLSLARELIEEGGFVFVRDVAEAVGYTDPLYFSRIYKARFGISPKQAMK